MKRFFLVLIALLLVIGLVQMSVPKTVNAGFYVNKGLAPNDWDAGEPVTVDFSKYPAPEWLQLLTSPVKITTAGKFCHEFRGGQFGWVGEVRQLTDGKWVKVESTAGWVPSTEGKYMICTQASKAGTYALFGYFDPPEDMVFEDPWLPD